MDDFEDFEFGAELPEDDDAFNDKEEYDANNDMTFGEDIVADFDHPDLGNYADQVLTRFFVSILNLVFRPLHFPWTSSSRECGWRLVDLQMLLMPPTFRFHRSTSVQEMLS